MARKKRVADAVYNFEWELRFVESFAAQASVNLNDRCCSWAYDSVVIHMYRAFEKFMLDLLVTAINQDTAAVSKIIGRKLPKHLTAEVCEYLVVGNGYWDFKGRDGLIKTLRCYLPANHYLIGAVASDNYRQTIEQLVALRNFAAHSSPQARRRALEAAGVRRMYSSGAWLKCGARLETWMGDLLALARQVESDSPY